MSEQGSRLKLVEIKRIAALPYATFGVILDDYEPFALTLEPPWRDNERNVSCIPPGPRVGAAIYLCKRVESPRHGSTFEVLNVPGRSNILCAHKGNEVEDTEGCILIAEEFGMDGTEVVIFRSRQGMDEFSWRMRNVNKFALKINWCI